MKKLFTSYFLVFVLGFILFLYEPITMYSINKNDLSYDIYLIIKPILLTFFMFIIGGIVIFTMIYYLNKKYFPDKKIFEITLIIISAISLCLYVEGNYLSGSLPRLDGTEIIWNNYLKENIISFTIWALIIVGAIYLIKKYDVSIIIKYIKVGAIFIFLITSISLFIIVAYGNNVLGRKNPALATTTNFNLASTNNNFYILLLDAVDSVMFEEVMKNNNYQSVFNDFTYYKDTTSTYVYTRDSIPYILSGKWNHNKKEFNDYSTEAMDNSYLIELLKNNNYDINIFSDSVIWDSDKSKIVSNMVRVKQKIDRKKYLNEQKKYILFKYLPYPLKSLSNIETLNFNNGIIESGQKLYKWDDVIAYENFNKKALEKKEEKIFKFIHIEGAHLPFNLTKDVKYLKKGKGKYDDKLEASINIINAFLNQLKENNVYDNSAIIIMSDHGFALGNGHIGRQNPIFFVKGVDEHHDLSYSDKKISYTDLNDLYTDLLMDKKGEELFANVSNNRERTVILYEYLKENKMVEFRQTGNAWNEETMESTGEKFILK